MPEPIPYPAVCARKAEKVYVLTAKIVDVQSQPHQCVKAFPKVTFVEGAPVGLQMAGRQAATVKVASGGVEFVDEAPMSNTMRCKVTPLKGVLVRLNLSMRQSTVEKENKNGVLTLSQSMHAVQKVHLGKTVKFVCEKDSEGKPLYRVEVTVKEVKD